MHNPTRKLLTRATRVTRGLAPTLWARFPRKHAPRNIATSARNMGVHIPCTIPRIVVGTRKMEWENPTSQAFPVPKIHKGVLIKEIERLCNLGVLEWQHASEWASPSFIVPKQNNNPIYFLSNFWEVNKRLIRKPFPIHKMSMVLQKLEGISFATAINLNMGYYTIRLDPGASKICTIIFPWGKYFYKHLPIVESAEEARLMPFRVD
jgi:hypothetical protein